MAKKVKKVTKKATPKKKTVSKKAPVKKSAKKTTKKATPKKKVVKKAVGKKAPVRKTKPASTKLRTSTSAKLSTSKKAVKKTVKKTPSTSSKLGKSTSAKLSKSTSAKLSTSKKAAPAIIKKSVGINPYLTFDGNCEEAFNFYKSVFGGSFPYIGRFGEMPPMDGMTVPESEKNKIMHMSLPIGANSVLMGSDSSDSFGHATIIGNNFSISLNATSQEEADKFYKGLSAGGKQTMPMNKTFWGSYFGMLVDKFGINWMISFETGKPM